MEFDLLLFIVVERREMLQASCLNEIRHISKALMILIIIVLYMLKNKIPRCDTLVFAAFSFRSFSWFLSAGLDFEHLVGLELEHNFLPCSSSPCSQSMPMPFH